MRSNTSNGESVKYVMSAGDIGLVYDQETERTVLSAGFSPHTRTCGVVTVAYPRQ